MVKNEEVVEDLLDAEIDVQQDQSDGPEAQVDELEQSKKELAETKDSLLRLAADFENYKKRMERTRLDAMKYREEALLKEILPVVDNLNRAIDQGKSCGESSELLEGVELTCKGLFNVLEKFEVTPLESLGEPFDPNLHEALAMDHSEDVAENHVLVEFEKGYQYKDKLIRPAKVVVSKGTAT